MYMSTEDARSDFILAGAAALVGPLFITFVFHLPVPDPFTSTVGAALRIGLVFAITGLVPLLLARYRDQGLAAFGLTGEPSSLGAGLLLAVPVAAAGFLEFWTNPGPDTGILTSLLARLSPTLTSSTTGYILNLAQVVALGLGALLLYTFLSVRARDAFRQVDLGRVEALRTFGMGGTAVTFLLGLLNAVRPGVSLAGALRGAAALAIIVLLADRLVHGGTTTRSTVLAPGIVAILSGIFNSGGLFSGDLLRGLYEGAGAATVVIVIAVLIDARQRGWAVVPLVAAISIYPVIPLQLIS